MNPEKNNPWKLLETSLNLGEIRKIPCKKKQKMIKNKIKIRFCIQWNVIIVYWNYEAWKLGENIPFLTQSWLRNLKMLREVIRDFLFGVFLKLGKILLLSHQFIILLWWWRYANWILELGFWECNQVFRWAVNVALDL